MLESKSICVLVQWGFMDDVKLTLRDYLVQYQWRNQEKCGILYTIKNTTIPGKYMWSLYMLSNLSWATISILRPYQKIKMVDMLHIHFIFWIQDLGSLIKMSLQCVPRNPSVNQFVLIQEMVWHRTGNTPLPKPIMTQFAGACMPHRAETQGWNELSKTHDIYD